MSTRHLLRIGALLAPLILPAQLTLAAGAEAPKAGLVKAGVAKGPAEVRAGRSGMGGAASQPLVDNGPAAGDDSKRHLLLLTSAAKGSESLLQRAQARLMGASRFSIVRLSTLGPLMRQRDRRQHRLRTIRKLHEEARKAMLALEHVAAKKYVDDALALAEESFVGFYDPRSISQLHLLAGVLALQRGRPDRAARHFTKALHFWPTLNVDAHYSPQVRAAFEQARKTLGAKAIPSAAQMQRLTRIDPRIRYALVLAGEQASGSLVLIKASLFDPKGGAYAAVESVGILRQGQAQGSQAQGSQAQGSQAQGSQAQGSQAHDVIAFADRLRDRISARFPAPLAQTQPTAQPTTLAAPTSQPDFADPGNGSAPGPPPTPRPWYRRWYIWAAAAAVVGTAVAIPLIVRQPAVDVAVSW